MSSFETDVALSPGQNEIVNRLLHSLQDVNHRECTSISNLVRWLRSRNWNEHEAEKMLRCHVNWRRERGVDSILSWYRMPEVIDKYFPGGVCGSDKQGRPLFIAPVGRFDPKSFMKSVSRTEFLQSRIYQMEYILRVILPEASSKAGREIDQLTVLMDMQGLGFKHMSPSWLSIVTESVSMIEANYPEVLGSCYVVNAPPLFSRLYSFVKPLLSKATQEKVHILDSNYQETLLLHFNAESLPAIYGGSMVDADGDPRCSSQICWAGPVPDSLFKQTRQSTSEDHTKDRAFSRSNSAQSLGTSDRFTVVEVNRGAQRDIPVGYLARDVELSWCVVCESHDIGIGWFVQPSNTVPSLTACCSSEASSGIPCMPIQRSSQTASSNSVVDVSRCVATNESLWEVLPIQRITAEASPCKGKYKVRVPGSYYMRLDNSYSWMRGKRIRYVLNVSLPKESVGTSILRNIPSHHSTEVVYQSNVSCPFPETTDTCPNDKPLYPLPLENPSHSRLVTGGSMDVNISLLFRLLAQLILVPKSSPGPSTG